MNTKKKSAPVLAHRDAQRKIPNYSLAFTRRAVKQLLSGGLFLIAALCGMLTYGAAVERLYGWLISLPCCVLCTLAAVWLWRQAEGGDGHDE